MDKKKDVPFFPVFFGATMGAVVEIIAAMFVDEMVAGNILSDEAFAAVNLIEPYVTPLDMFIAYIVVSAATALIIRAQGAGDHEKMNELFSQTLIMCGICGIVLTSIYVIFTPQLVRFVADDPAVYDEALAYFKVMRFYPLLDIFDTFMFTYVLYRNGSLQFYSSIFVSIGLNALLSWYLGLQMGIMGIGIATIVSMLIAFAIRSSFMLSSKHTLRFKWHMNLREIIELAKLGFPESAVMGYIAIMEMAINNFTLSNYGAAGVAAVAVVVNVFEFAIYLSEGLSEYEIVAVNDSIGKNSRASMNHAIRTTLKATVIEGVALIGLTLIGSFVIPDVFGIDDEETFHHATVMLRIFAPAVFFICFSRVTAIFYQYTKRLSRTLILFGMVITLLPVLFAVIFGQLSLDGVGAGIAMGPAVAMAFMFIFVRFVKKEKLFDYALLNLSE